MSASLTDITYYTPKIYLKLELTKINNYYGWRVLLVIRQKDKNFGPT